MAIDLNALAVFQRAAGCRSFTAAAEQLGVTRSAVSQTIAKLEQSLGVALVLRTTRSVSLTDAGQALLVSVSPALAELGDALEASRPPGRRVRATALCRVLHCRGVPGLGPMLAAFAARYPALQLDITVTDEAFDIVGAGFDAGVRLGEVIAQTWSRCRCRRGSANWWCARRAIVMPMRFQAPTGTGQPSLHRLAQCAGQERPIAGSSKSGARVQCRCAAGNHQQRHGGDGQAGLGLAGRPGHRHGGHLAAVAATG
jgi:DNA-binding transcriptional LysR family regulator